MELSNRLETIASFVTEGYVVADIGTDHGYIPIYLTSNGNCPRAYAMDVNKEPLSRAKTHIEEENAGEVVSCILSDGLHEYQRYVDSVVIAGMGETSCKDLEQDLTN
ncbi:MAG: class I SAM-dependent methyltransferase [Anaerostipes hadrus]